MGGRQGGPCWYGVEENSSFVRALRTKPAVEVPLGLSRIAQLDAAVFLEFVNSPPLPEAVIIAAQYLLSWLLGGVAGATVLAAVIA